MLLQNYVVPVCGYKIEKDQAIIIKLFGTAFFINDSGVFLTAKHVVENARDSANIGGYKVGLVCKDQNIPGKNVIVEIIHYTFAPNEKDIAIGQTMYLTKSLLRLSSFDVDIWQDVATFGYPDEAISKQFDSFWLNLRAQKGYIQRIINDGDIPLRPNASGYEISFVLAAGMSGAPLFVHGKNFNSIIGVCIGMFASETVEEDKTDVDDNGKIYSEKRVISSRYGLAEAIGPILDWVPDGFNNLRLRELSFFTDL